MPKKEEYEASYMEAVKDHVKRSVIALGKKIQGTGVGVTIATRPQEKVDAAEQAAMYDRQTTDSNNR